MVKNKKIYIILTYSGTMLSKLIRIYTKDPYCHVSVALDKNLNEMYSFGRLHPYCPFFAGFVKESPYSGTFKRFKNTQTEIYSFDVSVDQYEMIKNLISSIHNRCGEYHFNIIGLFAVGFHIKYQRKNSFYCAEFVKYVMEHANLDIQLPELVKPIDFQNQQQMNLEYKGILEKYCEFIEKEKLAI